MVLNERQSRADRVFDAGKMMMTAARTAPKAKGLDNLECCLVVGDDIRRMSDMMLMLHGRPDALCTSAMPRIF